MLPCLLGPGGRPGPRRLRRLLRLFLAEETRPAPPGTRPRRARRARGSGGAALRPRPPPEPLVLPSLVRAGQVRHAQPQAPGIPEEGERDQRRKRDPERQLLDEGQADRPVEREDGSRRHADGDRVVDVDRAHEVALLALVAQPAGGAAPLHGEQATVEGRAATAWAAQAERPA